MYCTHCGKSIPEDSVFCPLCGQSLEIKKTSEEIRTLEEHPYEETVKQNDKENDVSDNGNTPDYFDIEIPGIGGGHVVRFTNDYVSYKDKQLNYSDITAISCKQINHSTNLIPTNQEFVFAFYGTDNKIILNFGTALNIGSNNRKEIFYKLFSISKGLIVPILVTNLVNKILKEDKIIKIGEAYFNKNGYYRRKFFGGEDWVHWEDNVAEPMLNSGSYNLYKENNGNYRHFSSIPLEMLNSILIPELVQSLYSIYNSK